jgi:hypothetical protein
MVKLLLPSVLKEDMLEEQPFFFNVYKKDKFSWLRFNTNYFRVPLKTH